jgi:hypothetical protein
MDILWCPPSHSIKSWGVAHPGDQSLLNGPPRGLNQSCFFMGLSSGSILRSAPQDRQQGPRGSALMKNQKQNISCQCPFTYIDRYIYIKFHAGVPSTLTLLCKNVYRAARRLIRLLFEANADYSPNFKASQSSVLVRVLCVLSQPARCQ